MYPDIWFRTYIPTHTIWQVFFPTHTHTLLTHMFYFCVPLGCTFLFATEKNKTVSIFRVRKFNAMFHVNDMYDCMCYHSTRQTHVPKAASAFCRFRTRCAELVVYWLRVGQCNQRRKGKYSRGEKIRSPDRRFSYAFMTGNGLFPSRFATVPRITWVRLTSYARMGSKPRGWSSSALCRANLASMNNEGTLSWSCTSWCVCSFMRAISTHWDDYCVRYRFRSTFVETCFSHNYCKIVVLTCADVYLQLVRNMVFGVYVLIWLGWESTTATFLREHPTSWGSC